MYTIIFNSSFKLRFGLMKLKKKEEIKLKSRRKIRMKINEIENRIEIENRNLEEKIHNIIESKS